MADIDAVVAGAGIWGCVVARRLAEKGRKVLLIDKRSFIGGNVRCEIDDETNIEIHLYGSHIFHTKIPKVWEFANRFTSFNSYHHKVLAAYKGKMYFLPIGLALINKFFSREMGPQEAEEFMKDTGNQQALFDAFFRGYTSKQWGRAPEEIDSSIISRLPVRRNWNIDYFSDPWQGIPLEGYNEFFRRIVDHPLIMLKLDTSLVLEAGLFKAGGEILPRVPIYSSAPIDALFANKFGALPWRSLRFEQEKLPVRDWQGTSVVNYTEGDIPYTRIHEFKHYHPEDERAFNCPKTIIMREYPKSWQMGDEPYYPIDDASSRELVALYRKEKEKYPLLHIGGRLGAYKYFDMDRSIEAALDLDIE
ncbi:MAG: NAD(P)-binding protein [Kiritimatiellae bacterium]|nr:NAD(P)-binding protein [Kiritimatiellia bacterium]